MDPPRQVSRRGPGTGPVFKNFKKSNLFSSATKPLLPPAAITSKVVSSVNATITIHDDAPALKKTRMSFPIGSTRRKHVRTIDIDANTNRNSSTTETLIPTARNKDNKSLNSNRDYKISNSRQSSSPQRKEKEKEFVFPIEIKEDVSAVVVPIPDKVKRNSSSSNQRNRVKRQSVESLASEKVNCF